MESKVSAVEFVDGKSSPTTDSDETNVYSIFIYMNGWIFMGFSMLGKYTYKRPMGIRNGSGWVPRRVFASVSSPVRKRPSRTSSWWAMPSQVGSWVRGVGQEDAGPFEVWLAKKTRCARMFCPTLHLVTI